MYNIIRSQFHDHLRSKYIWGWMTICMIIAFYPLLNYHNWSDGHTASELVVNNFATIIFAPVYYVYLVAVLCSTKDFKNKTLNYEILSGHSRAEVYWGRTITTLYMALIPSLVLILCPFLIMIGILGWGEQSELSWVLVRMALIFLATVRLTCGLNLVSVATGNELASSLCGIAAGGLSMLLGWLLHMVYPNYSVINGLFCFRTIASLGDFNEKFGYIDGKDCMIADASVPMEFLLSSVISSLICIVLALLLGHFCMKKKEL